MERRLQQIFFALSFLALALILAAAWQANTPTWKTYQRKFLQLEAQGEPNAVTKAAVLATPPEVHQVMLTGLQRVDRCTTCHLGATANPFKGLLPNSSSLNGSTVPVGQLLTPYPQYALPAVPSPGTPANGVIMER